MLKALVPVDGSSNSLCAVRHVISLVQDRDALEIPLTLVKEGYGARVGAEPALRAVSAAAGRS